MSTTVTYKGSIIATVNNNTKTLKTAGTYVEGDIELVDVAVPATITGLREGFMCTIPDGTAGDSFLGVIAGIYPIQSGTGDPSPSNIRPFTGFTSAKVIRSSQNIFDWANASWKNKYYINASGNEQSINDYKYTENYILVNPSTTYLFQMNKGTSEVTALVVNEYDRNFNFINRFSAIRSTSSIGRLSGTGTTTSNTHYIRINAPYKDNNTTGSNNFVIKEGSDSIGYEATTQTAYTLTFPNNVGTVYGGKWDVTGGKLIVTHGQIASYAGETLPGAWISDRDVYAPGTSPTTGAQVVYELDTPVEYSVPVQVVPMLAGVNEIWSDVNDAVQCIYVTGEGEDYRDIAVPNSTFIQGEFTANSSTGVQSITIPYAGSGYPIMLSIVIKNGMYNNTSGGNTTWYNSKQRYAVGYWAMTKAEMNTAPTYTTSGSNNYGSMMSTLKNSTSDNTNYTRSGSVNANVFSSSNPSNTAANCVKFKGDKELAVYVSTSSYGLYPSATYSYCILYSA